MATDPAPFYRAILLEPQAAITLIDDYPIDHRFPMVFHAVVNTLRFIWPTGPDPCPREQTLDCCCADWGEQLRDAFDFYLSFPYSPKADNNARIELIDTRHLADAGLRMPWSIMSRTPAQDGAVEAFADLLAEFDPPKR